MTSPILESWKSYVAKSSLEELRECWEAGDDFCKKLLDAAMWLARPDEACYWWFYRKRLTIEPVDSSVVDQVIAKNEAAWKDYVGGKDAAIGRLMGALVKAGMAPDAARKALEERRK